MADLWALHIQGSDDIIPAPTRAEAERGRAACDEYDRRHTDDPVYPRMRAVVIPWPGTPEAHAAGLVEEEDRLQAPPVVAEAPDGR